MPTRYWRNLPEAARISALTQTAHQRSAQMVAAMTTVPQRRIAGAPAAKPAQQTSHHSCDGHGDFYNNNERGGLAKRLPPPRRQCTTAPQGARNVAPRCPTFTRISAPSASVNGACWLQRGLRSQLPCG